MKSLDKEALEYHAMGKPGKVDVRSSKPCSTEKALSLAYSPGVAAPCLEIARDPSLVYDYTTKGNLVAVISNGTAVLGLGNIGPLAAKPVMEGKGVLFKNFADIDVFDIELKTKSIEEVIAVCKALEPTFGGINLEDIKAPECFEIEQRLKEEMNIPVFHDDQHGTAIICGAALINACHITGKKIGGIKIVVNGAGAAAISCAKIFMSLGATRENIVMCDSTGVIYKGRKEGMNKYKEVFAADTKARTLADAVKDSDVFVGLSVAGVLTEDMVKTMADKPVIFAMANPVPEIDPVLAKKARPDAIVATGRSDYPNQVNNVLGFPYIFRGALDVRARRINEEMKLAAVRALAELAHEDVPDRVSEAYGGKSFKFGPDYIIPKPFDPRVLLWVAPVVAKAAMDTGVAQKNIPDFQAYREKLESTHGKAKVFMRSAMNRLKEYNRGKGPPKIVFPEGTSPKMLKALHSIAEENIIEPILLGDPDAVRKEIAEMALDSLSENVPVIDPKKDPRFTRYVDLFYQERQRKGITLREAERCMASPHFFAAMMLKTHDADGFISGSLQNYEDAIKPVLNIIGTDKGDLAFGLNIVIKGNKLLFFADTTVSIDPTAEQLAQIALHTAQVAEFFGVKPRIALLSYSNFSGRKDRTPSKMVRAAEIIREKQPDLMVDGEMQADTAINADIMEKIYGFSRINGEAANILIFPNLESSNISYKLIQQLGGSEVLGPFLMGVKQAANIVQRTTNVDSIINTIVFTALESHVYKEFGKLWKKYT